jgi:O-antigen/teichoic acid export membrane protein
MIGDRPQKPNNAEGLRRWRERQAWRTSRASVVARLSNYAIRLAVIPLSLRLLGAEKYGLWLTVGSLIAWLGVSDLGISRGLLNAVAKASGAEDRPLMQSHVSTALLGYVTLGVPAVAFVLLISRWQGLGRLLHIAPGTPLAKDAGALVFVCGGLFALSLMNNVVTTSCAALQEGYLAAWATVAGAAASLALLAAFPLPARSVIDYALVMAVPSLLANFALGVYIFGWRHPELRPGLSLASLRSLRIVAGFGGPLMLVEVGNLVMLYSTNLLIANRLGPAAVPQFTVPNSLFFVLLNACYLLAAPYVPAFAEASGRGDWVWLRRRAITNLRNTMGLILLGSAGLIALGRPAIRIYTHSVVVPTASFLVAMAGYGVLMVWAMTNGVLLIGLGRVGVKAAIHLSVAAVYLSASWLLLPRLGVIAVPIAGALGYLVDAVWSLPCALRYIRHKTAEAGAGPRLSVSAKGDVQFANEL